jgi:transcriptional regulator with XRE-family HTH domain
MAVAIAGTVRMIRDTRTMTQQQLADAAGVSVSTIRRLERDADARFHPETEHRLEFALKLKEGALEHLRGGGLIDDAFDDKFVIWFGRSDHYRDAPLSDIVVQDSYVATVLAKSLEAIGSSAAEELSLAAGGRLVPGAGGDHRDFLFDWLPWPARVLATVPWLHRAHDSAAQVRSVLGDGLVPRPLRMAEAVMLKIAYDRSWAIDTNAFFDDGDEIEDPVDGHWDLVYDHRDPRPLFDRARSESEWVPPDSDLHPHRWWVPLPAA